MLDAEKVTVDWLFLGEVGGKFNNFWLNTNDLGEGLGECSGRTTLTGDIDDLADRCRELRGELSILLPPTLSVWRRAETA